MLRITQQMLQRNSLNQIQARQNDLFTAQKQISSGYRFDKPSEDPSATAISLDLRKAISFQERIGKNASTAQDFNLQADHELSTAGDIFQRARELAIRSADEALNQQQLDGISSELEGLLTQLTDIGNATHEGNYIFGGYQSSKPPFRAEKNLVIEGTAMTELSLNKGTFKTQLETHSLTTVAAGSFSLNGGDLVINGVDIGSFHVVDPARTAADNAQALVERINAKTAETGVSAQAINFPTGSYAAPGAAPLTGIALVNLDKNGSPSNKPIEVSGQGIPGVGGLNVFRNERLLLSDTRFTSLRIGAGAIGNVPAGTLSINGVTLNSAINFAAGNSAEQNAQAIATALNSLTAQTEVYAKTDGNGFVQLQSQTPFQIAGAPAQLNLPNQVYEQSRNASAVSGAVGAGSAMILSKGSLVLNGIDIFNTPLTLDATLTAPQRAQQIVTAINNRATDTGIRAFSDATGRLYFSNGDQHITSVSYQGDSGENLAQIGSQELLPLNMSGDQAFAGQRAQTRLLSGRDILAAGLGSAVSTANVSFAAGDTLVAGNFVINGTNILAGPFTGGAAADAATLIAAINAQSGTTGVSALASGVAGIRLNSLTGAAFNLQTTGNGSKAQIPATAAGTTYLNPINAGDILINGVDIGPIAAVPANPGNPPQNIIDLADALVNAINNQAATTGVKAERITASTGGTRVLLTATGQDIRVDTNNPVANAVFNTIGLQPGTVVRQKIDAFDALVRFRNQALNSKFNRDAVQTISVQSLREVDDAFTALTGNRVELGVRGQRAELVGNRVAQTQEVLSQQLADQRETDVTKAISQMTLHETALQAAYNMTQRLSGLSLLNYI
ncbi:flagellar hook-associated protein 3 [bacterium (Candidatus Blackallbacteria) CG17_big_fil_post_rev_8_21_14_2_50_48_46]|uniref:Flagellar hook-associated protein 3 n=1 Tax=bacterium (Candidatus Blackallbacteria) CG17_big_fil_post_rev_8_21_14_2_50_48_46 TaxID=2014261 RepID=A0A2M7G476_9BACT|nr:MAG: flagellar hook-associated protein 3 [bacterium (Candidatus Blackallbacteria) CG18_big_fil_WC_8_21_14_2_50_49_26]PIW16692.1 MAG: flagellar hook-associated protein 3 [bacterium (Candidatus Blackallbacteria) CG17_big_fil_post_rev_8_21_14_2_50_48_46]PIW46198.1 MAG: flagellar hook-associated protein 3 [bacterium (Candidatus Blackallbacteria) CG13_big_fil_rev_8_21_14_2_50_49_14]